MGVGLQLEGGYNGSSGFVVTDRAIYGYVNGERYYLPYKGLFQVVEEKGNIFLHYMDGSKINAYRVSTLYCKELMEFLEAAASENFDYSMKQSRERMKKYRTCGDHDFCEHIYRFQDSEFVVLGVHHSEDNWNDLTYLIREIHEGIRHQQIQVAGRQRGRPQIVSHLMLLQQRTHFDWENGRNALPPDKFLPERPE